MSLIALLCPYFLASIIAAAKEKKKSRAIFFVDLLFGWAGTGWIVAIVWALIKDVSVSGLGNLQECQRSTLKVFAPLAIGPGGGMLNPD